MIYKNISISVLIILIVSELVAHDNFNLEFLEVSASSSSTNIFLENIKNLNSNYDYSLENYNSLRESFKKESNLDVLEEFEKFSEKHLTK